MRKTSLFIAAFLCSIFTYAQINFPAASPTQTIEQDFGLGKIKLTYSRPSIKGRAVFQENSELAPLGQLWRTGANAATRVTFTDQVLINGTTIDTGSYALYTIPGAKEWEVVLNKGIKNWGTGGYKTEDDVVRVKVPVTELASKVESFTMQFSRIQPESCELHLMWNTTDVAVPIQTRVVDRLKNQLENALQTNEKKPYWQAANFYYDFDRNDNKALENVNKALETNPNAFYMYLLKAKIQQRSGDAAGAKVSAQKCVEEATKQKNEDYVRSAEKFIATL